MPNTCPRNHLTSPVDKTNSKFKLISLIYNADKSPTARNFQICPTAHACSRHMQATFNFRAKITLQQPNLTPDHMPAMCACPASPNLPLGFNLLNRCSCLALSLQLV
ncbi:hypothetical protein RDI58_017587 [Solanum bulbocastanum]|uniref:Uncharacterized protein n=1 Tax=Solanum bulbocastanum TaxID=147425 RepID=A0AAN8TGC5_SOLBU